MKKTLLLFSCLLLAVSLSFMGCDHDDGGDDDSYEGGGGTLYATLTVWNYSSYTLNTVNLPLSTSSVWGTDYLDGYLYNGDYLYLYNIPAGYYDIRVCTTGGGCLYDYDLYLTGGYDYDYYVYDSPAYFDSRSSDTETIGVLEKKEAIEKNNTDGIKYQQ